MDQELFSCGKTGCPKVQEHSMAIREIQVDRAGSKEMLKEVRGEVKEIFKRLNTIEVRVAVFVGLIVAVIDVAMKYLPGGVK